MTKANSAFIKKLLANKYFEFLFACSMNTISSITDCNQHISKNCL